MGTVQSHATYGYAVCMAYCDGVASSNPVVYSVCAVTRCLTGWLMLYTVCLPFLDPCMRVPYLQKSIFSQVQLHRHTYRSSWLLMQCMLRGQLFGARFGLLQMFTADRMSAMPSRLQSRP